jgi:flagellar biosynthesis/type III secretory pathway protein FliH
VSDIVPFLTAVASASAPKPLQATLKQIVTAPVTSPWSPQPTPSAAPAAVVEQPTIDVEAITAQAIEEGRAQGLAETEQLRSKLVQMIAELDRARQAFVAPAAEMIAGAAGAVVEGWIGATDRAALFRPVVESWLTSGAQTATARCHPADADALRGAIAEAAITVKPDVSIKPGDVTIADATRELAHAWEPRLRELREAIAGALTE